MKLRKQHAGVRVKASHCPECGHHIDAATGATKADEGKRPKPKDLTICAYCAAVLRYGPDMGLCSVPELEVKELGDVDPVLARNIKAAVMQVQYINQIQGMANNARRWRQQHPQANALIQFNFPSNMGLIVTIEDAIEKKLIICNDDGLSLLKSLWPEGGEAEPTVIMTKIALDLSQKNLPL
jgi:hypothetical protein